MKPLNKQKLPGKGKRLKILLPHIVLTHIPVTVSPGNQYENENEK